MGPFARKAIIAVLVLGMTAVSCHRTKTDEIAQLISEVSEGQLKSSVQTLVAFGSRNSLSANTHETWGIGAAQKWVKAQFESVPELEVGLDCFQKWGRENCNVFAELPGHSSSEEFIVISAHYDSMASDAYDSRGLAPGADDNASGVAVMLEVARLLAKKKFSRTIVFLATVGEEQGLVGARHYAENAKASNKEIIAMITNDIVGSSDGLDGGRGQEFSEYQSAPNRLRVYSDWNGTYGTDSKSLAEGAKESVALHFSGFELDLRQYVDRAGRGGDHIAFLEKGYPAIRLTEPFEDHKHQHQNVRKVRRVQYGDLAKFLEFDYMARVVGANIAIISDLAGLEL